MEALLLCKKFWQTLGKHGCTKGEGAERMGLPMEPGDTSYADGRYCYACDYHDQQRALAQANGERMSGCCDRHCIIDWPQIYGGCHGDGSPYDDWFSTEDKDTEMKKHHARRVVRVINKSISKEA
jgi:hypothetical protein